jgi:hypothetical protein
MFVVWSGAMLASTFMTYGGKPMQEQNLNWARWGALALGLSGLLWATFPLVRPFYDDLARDPTGAAQTISSLRWVLAHLMLIIALVLLPFGLLTVFADQKSGPGRRLAFIGMVLGIAGGGLYLPVGGVEAFALPAIAQSYLQSQTGTLDLIDAARSGLRVTVFGPGLVLLGLGGIFTGLAVWRSQRLPRWAGLALALGLVFFLPLLPQTVRIIDGLLIGIGAIWLAGGLWQTARSTTNVVRPENI